MNDLTSYPFDTSSSVLSALSMPKHNHLIPALTNERISFLLIVSTGVCYILKLLSGYSLGVYKVEYSILDLIKTFHQQSIVFTPNL